MCLSSRWDECSIFTTTFLYEHAVTMLASCVSFLTAAPGTGAHVSLNGDGGVSGARLQCTADWTLLSRGVVAFVWWGVFSHGGKLCLLCSARLRDEWTERRVEGALQAPRQLGFLTYKCECVCTALCLLPAKPHSAKESKGKDG
jgi:hypothetical protein